jgi:hypothetical protein
MKTYSVEIIKSAISKIKIIAEEKRESAAWGGAWGDNGASTLLDQLDVFTTIWNECPLSEDRIPKFMKPIVIDIERQNDEDYQTYLKLKKRYE